MTGFNGTQADSLIAAVNAVNELNRVWEKGRKRRLVNDVAWRRALSEYIQQEEMAISSDTHRARAPEPSVMPGREGLRDLPERDEPLLEAGEVRVMMREIRKLTEEPERLLESHLGVFTDPAPPGRMLNSSG